MQRVTVSLDEDLAQSFDVILRGQGYSSRSEAVRDLVRQAVEARRLQDHGHAASVASLSYVYDHHTRSLARRLVAIGHEHHDLVVSTTHVHLDHDSCLETSILRGPACDVQAFADRIQAERGVRFCHLNLITASAAGDHDHDSERNPAPPPDSLK